MTGLRVPFDSPVASRVPAAVIGEIGGAGERASGLSAAAIAPRADPNRLAI